jgi:hypothetical protein
MGLAYGFNGVKNEITHITLPNGEDLPEFKNYKADFDECQRVCKLIERSYNAGVVAEGKRILAMVSSTIYKS